MKQKDLSATPDVNKSRSELLERVKVFISTNPDSSEDFMAIKEHMEVSFYEQVVEYAREMRKLGIDVRVAGQDLGGANQVKSRFSGITEPLERALRGFKSSVLGPKAAPQNCELFLSLLLSKAEQEPAIGDFLERYAAKRKRLGRARADIWAYNDVLRTVWPVVRRRIMKLFKIVVAAEWFRRQFYQ